MPFHQIIMHELQCQHDINVHLVFLFWPWPPYNLLMRLCLTWILFVDPRYAFSTNYHIFIAIPTWRRCAPHIFLFWPWPPYTLLLRSCLTHIFFVDSHWWVQLCMQHPAKAMPFQHIIMHALHYQQLPTPILFWPWPAFNLFPSSPCLTWIFFIDSHW